jgi:selenide,water dikinase
MHSHVRELVSADCIPGGTLDNAARNAAFTTFDKSVDETTRLLLSDAQTSGGLLIAVTPEAVDQLREDLRGAGVRDDVIGQVRTGSGIVVK